MAGGQTSASFCSTSQRGVELQWIDPWNYFSPEVDGDEEQTTTAARNFAFDAFFLAQETLGISQNCELHFFRDVKSAAKVNSAGSPDEQLEIVDGVAIAKLRSAKLRGLV